MPSQKHKRIVIFLSLIFFFFVFSLPCFASSNVVINEILPNPVSGNEWVEFYNPDNINLIGWILEEKASSGEFIQHTINEENLVDNLIFDVFTFSSNKLNNKGDTVRLWNDDDKVDEYSFGKTESGISYGRYPDGGEKGFVLSSSTKGKPNSSPSPHPSPSQNPSPSPSPSPSQNPSPSPSSESSSAICQINEAKDKEGNVLSSVKIYIDGVYIHHLVPEMLEFGDGCKCGTECDENIDFNFGQHTIKLSKSGYGDWEETKTINQEEDCDINPVMNLLDIESPSPSPSPSDFSPLPSAQTSPSPKPKPSIKNQTKEDEDFKEASFTGEVFGASESSQKQTAEPAEKKSEKQKHSFLPLIISYTQFKKYFSNGE